MSNSGDSCLIANDDTEIYDVTNLDKFVQDVSGNMKAIKSSKPCIKVRQGDESSLLHTLWLVNYYVRVSENLFSSTCKLCKVVK